jgi:low temperature requirement protein LtrA
LEQPWVRIVFYTTLLLNYAPPFLTNILLRKESLELNLSASMSERLGLFTIIVFGEVVLGVVNGISQLHELSVSTWINFGLAISIVFSLWWIFFAIISDKECRKGFVNASFLEILFIPTLMALGSMSVVFSELFKSFSRPDLHLDGLKKTFSFSLGVFILGINMMLFLLESPHYTSHFKKRVQQILLIPALLFLILTGVNLPLPLFAYLLIVLIILLSLIIFLNKSWYALKSRNDNKKVD